MSTASPPIATVPVSHTSLGACELLVTSATEAVLRWTDSDGRTHLIRPDNPMPAPGGGRRWSDSVYTPAASACDYLHGDRDQLTAEQAAAVDDYIVASTVAMADLVPGRGEYSRYWRFGATLKTREQLARVEAALGERLVLNGPHPDQAGPEPEDRTPYHKGDDSPE